MVQDCNLIDLPLADYQFTWSKSKGKETEVDERIDRALVSASWLDLFPSAKLRSVFAPISDHSFLILNPIEQRYFHHQRPFKFENSWLDE